MFHLRLVFFFAITVLLNLPLHAVSVTTGGIRNQALFGIQFPGDARSYHAQEKAVLSISAQEYVTAAFRVLEVNIVTDGPALLRIYYSRALKPGELQAALGDTAAASGVPGSSIVKTPLPPQVEAMAGRASGMADSITSETVIKEYPIATHAHTIEFRVTSRSELLELHDELKKHWLKEPAFFENGQIIDGSEATNKEMKPRSLGGTLFTVEG
ncbi:MAG TPA: hypothetical protein VJ952_11730 [Opitutales bacterium]|nr:hypothetical protein [Opitutales bacterium]